MENNNFLFLTPAQAWEKLIAYKAAYYDSMAAMYSGDHELLKTTAEFKTFWQRDNGKCRIHVPIASDIAATSANLMFSQAPTFTVFHGDTTKNETDQQTRLKSLIDSNNLMNKLNEGGETCAALGDVYYKIRWNDKAENPIIDVVQPDQAWPEYILGELRCVHFFTELVSDIEKDRVVRAYELYSRGHITMKLFSGSKGSLGDEMPESDLVKLGYSSEIKAPIDDMLAVHIANIRPNRRFRSSMLGRSDLDGLRDLCDALDETYSSWMRDIRLAKARLIVPAEYLRKPPDSMIEGLKVKGAWEFDPDLETYVAMDIDTDRAGGTGITPSQPDIRSDEHMKTCSQLIQDILQLAGYSPQTFGLDINGSASSGTALNIRERKSSTTKNKKQAYWKAPLEQIMTALIRLDASLYPSDGSHGEDKVVIVFADSMGADPATIANTIEALSRAKAMSIEMMVRTQHPDWTEAQIADEVGRIRADYQLVLDPPDASQGDYDNGNGEDGDNDESTIRDTDSNDDDKDGEEVNE